VRLDGNPLALGAALIVGGMAIVGTIDNAVRLIAEDAGLWQFHLFRSLIGLPLLLVGLALLGLDLRPRRLGRVALRSAANAAAMLLYFGALPMMPIAQVGAALFTAPIWVLVFSRALFGHRIGPRRLAAVGLGFLGVLVMLRPDPANLSLVTLMPVAAGALYGLSNLLTREWCADEPVGALVAGFFLMMGAASALALAGLTLLAPSAEAVAAAPFLLEGWQAPTPRFLVWTLVQAAGSLVAVAMIYRGYQAGETSYLAVFEYSFLVFAATTAWIVWGEAVGPVALAGMAMIAGAGVIIALGAGEVRPAAIPGGPAGAPRLR
jgi:drug/metabolite transporter (DMT)-like permease